MIQIARKKREWYPQAVYHVMERGIRRQKIFEDEMDRQVFLEIMRVSLQKYKCTLHAYCMMTNHFHLLLETSDIKIGKFMKFFSGSYAIYFNRKYSYKGHLFEGRYKGYIIKEDSYFLQTSRYIHRNPVKAGIILHPEEYPWSSYRTIIGLGDDKLTYTDRTWRYFHDHPQMRYREFVENEGQKYNIEENRIRKNIGEDELWLPW